MSSSPAKKDLSFESNSDQVETTSQENVQNFANLLLLFFLLLSGGPNKPTNVQNFANLLFFRLQVTWLLKLGSRIDWQLEAVSSNPMILKHSFENSTIMTVKVFHKWPVSIQTFSTSFTRVDGWNLLESVGHKYGHTCIVQIHEKQRANSQTIT